MSQDNGSNPQSSNTTQEEAAARMKQRMESDAKFPESHPPPKGLSFGTIVLITAIGTVLLTPISWAADIIAAIVFRKKGEDEISRAIWTGFGIGVAVVVVGLGITCFVAVTQI